MRRKPRKGLSIGGLWTTPARDEIHLWELAFIVEATVAEVRGLLELGQEVSTVDLETANDLLADLARAGFTDWRESSMFAHVVAGRLQIEPDGSFFVAVDGAPVRRAAIERRTMNPPRSIELDVDAFVRRRREQAGRVRTPIVRKDGSPARSRVDLDARAPGPPKPGVNRDANESREDRRPA